MKEKQLAASGEKKEVTLPLAFRFYCNDNKECRTAEEMLHAAGVPFVKIEFKPLTDPVLITGQQICRNFDDISRFINAVSTIKKEYSVDWT